MRALAEAASSIAGTTGVLLYVDGRQCKCVDPRTLLTGSCRLQPPPAAARIGSQRFASCPVDTAGTPTMWRSLARRQPSRLVRYTFTLPKGYNPFNDREQLFFESDRALDLARLAERAKVDKRKPSPAPVEDDSVVAVDDDGTIPWGVEQPEEPRFDNDPVVKMTRCDAWYEDVPATMLSAQRSALKSLGIRARQCIPDDILHAKGRFREHPWTRYVHSRLLHPTHVYTAERAGDYLITEHTMSFAVLRRLLRDVRKRLPDLQVDACLDVGAGTAAAAWAALDAFGAELAVTCVEPAPHMTSIGKQVTESFMRTTEWHATLATLPDRVDFPVVVGAFMLQEVHPAVRHELLDAMWDRVRPGGVLVLADLATPDANAVVVDSRMHVLERHRGEARTLSPCPHDNVCPWAAKFGFLNATNDRRKARQRGKQRNFCHFGQRVRLQSFVEQSIMHARPRTASLVRFQNEYLVPFCYAVLEKPVGGAARPDDGNRAAVGDDDILDPRTWSRIVRPPLKRGGHVIIDACQSDATLQRMVVSRKNGVGGPYKMARGQEWGDLWPYTKHAVADDPGAPSSTDQDEPLTEV
ncbi:Methyltransferase domain-containing protein [Plasmodiophora brassicae]